MDSSVNKKSTIASKSSEENLIFPNKLSSLTIDVGEDKVAKRISSKEAHETTGKTKEAETDFELAVKEMDDREKRKSEIIIFNLPELNLKAHEGSSSTTTNTGAGPSTTISNVFDYDRKVVRDIFKEFGIADNMCLPKYLRRIGTQDKNESVRDSNPRPLIVSFYTQQEKELILSKTKLLKGSEAFRNVRIRANWTMKQREQAKKEIALAKERNEERYMLSKNQKWVWTSLGVIRRKKIDEDIS